MKKYSLILILTVFLITEGKSQLVQSNYTGVIVPRYICSGTTTRLPYIFRATVSGLIPNSYYRYYTNACRYTDFGGTNSGAGNPIYINGTTYRYTTSTSLATQTGYDSILTDASGNYTGWFGFVHTGNARFTAGNYVIPTITLDSAGNGATEHRFAMNDSILVLNFTDSATATAGTGIYGISLATPRNIISLYDNVSNTGRPLAVVFAESDGIDTSVMANLVQYYKDSVDSRNGRWGTVIPNQLSTGVRRINVHRITDAGISNFNTDADGIWPSGANTVNPNGGAVSPIRLSQQDAPLTIINNNIQPSEFKLEQNYPNPFNPVTTISFSIPENGFVKMSVYDILGREVRNLVNETMLKGTYSVSFVGSELNTGVYFYKIDFTGNSGKVFSDEKKMIVVK